MTLLSFFLLPFFEYFPDAMAGPNDLIACTQGYPYGIGLEWSSGAQIAGDTEFNVYHLSAPPLLWILPAAAGIALLAALILMSGTSGGRRVRAGSLLTFVSGIAGIASLVWLFVGLQAFIAVDAPQHNFSDTATLPGLSSIPASCLQGSYTYGIGFWLSLAGMLGLIAASVPVFSRLFGKVGAWLQSPACWSSSAGNRLVLLVQCLPDSLEARVEEGEAR